MLYSSQLAAPSLQKFSPLVPHMFTSNWHYALEWTLRKTMEFNVKSLHRMDNWTWPLAAASVHFGTTCTCRVDTCLLFMNIGKYLSSAVVAWMLGGLKHTCEINTQARGKVSSMLHQVGYVYHYQLSANIMYLSLVHLLCPLRMFV